MRIAEVIANKDGTLYVVAEDGRSGTFDVRPYLSSQAFMPLKDWTEFSMIRNGGYYVEWRCGADLSADTIEARWKISNIHHAQPSGRPHTPDGRQ